MSVAKRLESTRGGLLLSVIHDERGGFTAGAIGFGLKLLAYVYVAGLKLFLLPYRLGLRRQFRLPCPVVSVGNLTAGGTGKTPMTRRVCEILLDAGVRPCVLIRGYRGTSEHRVSVVSSPDRVELTAKEAGDEAYLLARLLPGVPVIAGKDRRKTGALAWERFRPDVFVLDDGMQFYQLHRDLEIALLDSKRPFDNGWTFPRGLLREPPSHLHRAHAVIITNADRVDELSIERLRATVGSLSPHARCLTAGYKTTSLAPLDKSAELPVEWLQCRPVATFCALGNPESFESQVELGGGVIVSLTRHPDHYEPTMSELQVAISRACEAGAEAIIVSEKDAVKLPPLARPLPFFALRAALQVEDEAALREDVLGVIQK